MLNATLRMIDDMVNFAIFEKLGDNIDDINLLPSTSDTLRLFNVLLRDFLSPVTAKGKGSLPFDLPKPDDGGKLTDYTTLFYLDRICQNPILGADATELSVAVTDFIKWLEGEALVPKVWLSNIGIELDIRVERINFIRICGDIGKHNFIRLGGQVDRIQALLKQNGCLIEKSDAYLAIPDIWDWFHTHLFAYHASTIAEFLNEIRYAIIGYMAPTARRVYRQIDEFRYDFQTPVEISEPFARAMYFDLMQTSLRIPYFPRFSVSKYLKMQF